jgi:uncharacterized membrane protein YesL
MDFMNSKLYRAGEIIFNLLALNLLWLFSCVLVVTIFPATAAMFGVVRQWIRNENSDVLGPYIKYFRENLGQSLGVSLVWTLATAILVADFYLLNGFDATLRLPMFVGLGAVGVCYAFTTVYLFPVMVNYRLGWWDVIKNSFLIAISQPHISILCIIIVVAAAASSLIFSVFMLLAGSVAAYLIYFLAQRAFERIEALKKRDAR